jgi:hypothetical protein
MPENQTMKLLYQHKTKGRLDKGNISVVLDYVALNEGVWGTEVKLHAVLTSVIDGGE